MQIAYNEMHREVYERMKKREESDWERQREKERETVSSKQQRRPINLHAPLAYCFSGGNVRQHSTHSRD